MQFCFDLAEILLTHGLFIEDWRKIVDFLLLANFWMCAVFFAQTLFCLFENNREFYNHIHRNIRYCCHLCLTRVYSSATVAPAGWNCITMILWFSSKTWVLIVEHISKVTHVPTTRLGVMISLVTVVKFHSEAGEFQYFFAC